MKLTEIEKGPCSYRGRAFPASNLSINRSIGAGGRVGCLCSSACLTRSCGGALAFGRRKGACRGRAETNRNEQNVWSRPRHAGMCRPLMPHWPLTNSHSATHLQGLAMLARVRIIQACHAAPAERRHLFFHRRRVTRDICLHAPSVLLHPKHHIYPSSPRSVIV